MDKVRIGLVGCGLFGQSHLEAFRGIAQAEVAAIFDIDTARAHDMAERFSVPRCCSSLEEICAIPELDAIDVVTPEATHLAPVLTAITNRKHVFVEKPMALDLKECDQMIDAAKRADRFLMVGHLLRFDTRCALLHETIRAGRLGKIVSMHARRNRPKHLLPSYGRTHPVIENSIHDIDLMHWYVRQPIIRVRGFERNATGSKHADTFWGVLEFEGGAIGVVETIWLLTDRGGIALDDSFQLIGTQGVSNLQLGNFTLWTEEGHEAPDIYYGPVLNGTAYGAIREELSYFCDCIRMGNAPSVITPLEARDAVRVALALVESARLGQDIELKNHL